MEQRGSLGWAELAPLWTLLDDPEATVRGAAAEAAARLPLTADAWEALGSSLARLVEDGRPGDLAATLPAARAAAHAPLAWLRWRLRDVAADGGHPHQRPVRLALSEVGDDTVLGGDVLGLRQGPLTAAVARRLASLPLERLPLTPQALPAVPADEPALSWWTAVAAARLGDPRQLDEWLRLLADGTRSWPPEVDGIALRGALPLPEPLLDRVRDRLAGGAARSPVAAAWLAAAPDPAAEIRPVDRTEPLQRFAREARPGVAAAERRAAAHRLATTLAGLPPGQAPEPAAVYRTWLSVGAAERVPWRPVAWALGRAGPAALVAGLAPWLGDEDAAVVAAACRAVAEAAALLDLADVPPEGRGGQLPWPAPAGPLAGEDRFRPPFPSGSSGGRSRLGRDVAAEAVAGETGPDWTGLPRASHGSTRRGARPQPQASPGAASATGPQSVAYALLASPAAVVVDQEFPLRVGLSARPSRGVAAEPLALPDGDSHTLKVQLVADGFAFRSGEEPTVSLDVTAHRPYPERTVHLTPLGGASLEPIRSILAVFSMNGRHLASAARAVEVVPAAADLPSGVSAPLATGVDATLASDAQRVDLVVTISRGADSAARRLLWTFESPHPSVRGSAAPLSRELPDRADQFARDLMRSAGRASGRALGALIRGAADRVADCIPAEVLEALEQAAAAAAGPPTVLLRSAEPYVPWELAAVPRPWVPAAPAILGAQAAVGRWALRQSGPTPEPPDQLTMRLMAVVRGEYQKTIGFPRLVHAEEEAHELAAAYEATIVDAAEDPIFDCLDGRPPAQVLHFAMHGKFEQAGVQNGLILVDGRAIEPLMVAGSPLREPAFVFLNACQVGQAEETLGEYGGLAQAFVAAGAAAVVAPLWAVKDDVAKKVSVRFYKEVLAGTSPAEFLRAERARLAESGTHLAYVLYGHPRLRLARQASGGSGQ